MEKALALTALLILVPAHAEAQGRGRIPDAVSAGATFGVSHSGNSRSGGGLGPQLTGHVEVPVRDLRVRLSLGHIRWTPSNDALPPGAEPAGRVGLSRLTVTAVLPTVEPAVRYPFGIYYGVGVGVYRYHIRHGSVAHRTARGLHAVGGLEYLTDDRRHALRIEVQIDAVGGPGHDQISASTMFGMSASIGMSRRF